MINKVDDIKQIENLFKLDFKKIFDFSLEISNSFFQIISPNDDFITYQNLETINKLGIEENDYVDLGHGVYSIDWKNCFQKYFDNNQDIMKSVSNNTDVLNKGKVSEIPNVFIYKGENEKEYFSRFVKKIEGNYVALFINITELVKTQDMNKNYDQITREVMRNTGTFFMEIVTKNENTYALIEKNLVSFSIMQFDDFNFKNNEQIFMPLNDFLINYVDFNFKQSDKLLIDKLHEVLNYKTKNASNLIKLKCNSSFNPTELYFKTNITRLENDRVFIFFTDCSDQYLNHEKEKLRKITDIYTGLRNRRALNQDYKDNQFNNCIVSYVNLKNLQYINEMYDRATGDIYLAKLGARLRELGSNTVCYRYAGDQFMVVTSDFTVEEIPEILKFISSPIQINLNSHKVAASMLFVDLKKNNFNNLNDIISILDFSKKKYRACPANSCIEVDEKIVDSYSRQKVLYKVLSQGFDRTMVKPLFQPFIDTKTKKVIGFETLARIEIDDVIYQPNEFIPVLESMNLIYKLDIMMFEESCKMKKKFDESKYSKKPFVASSNLSPRSFGLLKVDDFEEIVKNYGVDKESIKLELTEEDAINDRIAVQIEELIVNGYHISIDDFSAGHSSLKYIAEIQSNTLKVDRQLLNEINSKSNCKNLIIYSNIVSLAKALNMEVVSEGVETEEQVSALQKLGVNYLQGFFFSKPIPKIEFMNYALSLNN